MFGRSLGHVPADAAAFVDSRNRSLLGRFAVPREHLYLMHVVEVYRLRIPKVPTGFYSKSEEKAIHLFLAAEAEMKQVIPPAVLSAVRAELLFWWQDDGRSMVKTAGDDNRLLELGMSHDKVTAVAESPTTFHPFFMADIWDLDFIARCVAEDIDVELAVSLHSAGGAGDGVS